MKCPMCGGEMESGGLIADRYVSWVPQEEYERNALQALGGGYNGAKNLGKHSFLRSQTLGKRSTTARICSKPGRPCNPTGFVYSQSGVSRYFLCFTTGFQGIRRSRISWDGVLP